MNKETMKLLVLMEKCFDAGVLSGKEQAQRTWVGLNPEEVRESFQKMFDAESDWPTFAESIEAKLKEKNT